MRPPSIRIILAAAVLLIWPLSAWSQSKRSGFAEVNGTRLYYEMRGTGPDVVLIHGGLSDRRVWDDQFKEFAKRFRVIRYDLRGFGRSDFPTTPFSHVEDLYALIQALNIKAPTLVGLSLGGSIATDFALEHPGIAKKLVLTSSGLRGHKSARNADSMAVYKTAEEKGMKPAIDLWLKHPFFASGVKDRRFVKRTREMLEDNYRYWGPTPQPIDVRWPPVPTFDRLGQVNVPTLIIIGGADAANILAIADSLNSGIAGSKKVVIADAGHHLTMEKAQEYNRLVVDFMRN